MTADDPTPEQQPDTQKDSEKPADKPAEEDNAGKEDSKNQEKLDETNKTLTPEELDRALRSAQSGKPLQDSLKPTDAIRDSMNQPATMPNPRLAATEIDLGLAVWRQSWSYVVAAWTNFAIALGEPFTVNTTPAQWAADSVMFALNPRAAQRPQ